MTKPCIGLYQAFVLHLCHYVQIVTGCPAGPGRWAPSHSSGHGWSPNRGRGRAKHSLVAHIVLKRLEVEKKSGGRR